MSYSGNARTGNQRPQILLKPSNIADTHAEDVAGLSKAYGLTPDEWQYTVLEAWLGETEDGLFAASRCGLAVPRQNGKNGILEMVELYKMCILNRQILHTAHERSEEHTSELQSRFDLVCRLLLEKKKTKQTSTIA